MCFFRQKVIASAKHFVGDGGTTDGINENNTVTNRHELLSIHMPAYYDSIIKGVSTVMVSYSSWNGEKMHANRDLITGFLKKTQRFRVIYPIDFHFGLNAHKINVTNTSFGYINTPGFCHLRLAGN